MEGHLPAYHLKTSKGFLNYEFYSDGPKGRIKKVIRFTPRNAGGVTYFNLGFADWNEAKNRLEDRVVSNNGDRDKILATVAAAVMDFTDHYPDAWVFAKGSTPARTRLYQMGIASYWESISPLLHVYGLVAGEWQPFIKSVHFEAFLVLRK